MGTPKTEDTETGRSAEGTGTEDVKAEDTGNGPSAEDTETGHSAEEDEIEEAETGSAPDETTQTTGTTDDATPAPIPMAVDYGLMPDPVVPPSEWDNAVGVVQGSATRQL